MMLTHAALPLHIKKNLNPLYILSGTDIFLQENCAQILKQAFHKDCDIKKMTLQHPTDWETFLEEANSYSLFSEYSCLEAWIDKKTLDAAGKKAISRYLESINPKCLILLHALDIPIKQWQWLEKDEKATLLKIVPLEGANYRNWIVQQLNQRNLTYDAQVVDLLQQYTQGNQQACVQALEKLFLLAQSGISLTTDLVAEQIMDQSEWQIFDLTQACLQADTMKALNILRQAAEARIETTLVLWVLSQEIRQLSKLFFHLQAGMHFKDACAQLRIWNTRMSGYQKMLNRLSPTLCESLLKTCKKLDEQIKSGQTQTIWHQLESIALTLCLGSWRKSAC